MNEVIKTMNSLKTTRKAEFSTKPIDDNVIELIKDTILTTANASNRQSYSIIVLDKAKAKTLSLPGEKVFIFCIDFLRLKKCAELLDCDFDSQFFMQYSTALIDISLLVQSTIITAKSLGVDTLVTNEIYHRHLEKTFEELDIPKAYVFPMIAVCMGYSDTSKKQKGRVSSEYIFHNNQYNRLSDDDLKRIIEETNDKDRNIGLISDWDEKGFDNYYEWFFEKWSKAVGTKKESDHLKQSLREHKII